MKKRFSKQAEDQEKINPNSDLERFLVPAFGRKVEVTETIYGLSNSSFLYQYFPELFDENGDLKVRTNLYSAEEK